MREIKFRGNLEEIFIGYKGNIIFQKEEWIYGGITYNGDKVWIGTPYHGEVIVDKKTVGQYTGLKDENGKEIYEGDIIEFSYNMFVGNFDTFIAKGKVVFKEGAFYVEVFENEKTTKDEAYLLYSINLDTIKVIGNIYDNPELLEEKE